MPRRVSGCLQTRTLFTLSLLAGLAVLVSLPGPSARALSPGPLAPAALGPPQTASANDAATPRIAAPLRQAVAAARDPHALLPVIVVSQGPLATGPLKHAVARRPDARGLVFTNGDVPAGQVAALVTNNVVAVLSGAPPSPPVLLELSGMSGGRPDIAARKARGITPLPPGGRTGLAPPGKTAVGSTNPDSWHAVDVQDVRPAWQAGFRGTGVNVAVVDSGVDFGHPDLRGTYARVQDQASPYYGWPLAFDPASMELLAGGITGNIANATNASGSWYIDTAATIAGTSGRFTTVTATANSMQPVTHTYIMPGTSRSGVYHIGIFPDEHLAFDLWAEYPVVVVADTHVAGVYDTVYVDLLDSRDLRAAVALRKGHEVDGVDRNADGIPDLSTGMLYFIADGHNPVPASDWMYGLGAPDNGSLVALMGSYDYNEHHGTACASSVVAQGIIDGPHSGLRPPYKPAGIGGMVQGMAPDSRLVAIGNVYRGGMAIYDAYTLLTYGLDGRPGTGDEPQIASMSYGFSGGVDNGWDFQSRYIQSLQLDNPALSYVVATGNGGPGYGTETAPASAPNVISVGAATQYGETTIFDPISSTLDITSGDVQPWSNRGPSILGNAGPSVVAVGAWGTADDASNYARDGANAYDIWGGTSMATPVTAGVLALGYQAYRQSTGRWPNATTARELLMSSARDLHYGTFTQGAGLVDGFHLVNLAAGRAGLRVSPARWTPGQRAPAYAGFLLPGETSTTTVQLTNPGSTPLTATLGSDLLLETGHYDWTLTTSNTSESGQNFIRPDYLQDLTGAIPPGTDLMRVQAVYTATEFSLSPPNSYFLSWHSTWRLLAYDWQDKNGDGRLWQDSNHNGAVNDGEVQTGEYNRLWYSYPTGDMLEGYVEQPLSRIHDGLWIGLQHVDSNAQIPNTHLRLRATFYRHNQWSLVHLDTAAVTVPPHGTANAVATASLPANQAPGTYEGAIRVVTASGPIVVPIAINVALPALAGTFGGTPPATTTFDSGRMGGDLNWLWRADAGEWRHFFALNASPPPPNTFLWVNTRWPHYPSDFDTFLLGAAAQDYYSVTNPAVFGPADLWWMGGSQYLNEGGGQWQWATNTGSTAEWVGGSLLQEGLHEIVMHNSWYSGADFSEPFTGTLGTVSLSTGHLNIVSNNTRDSTSFRVTTSMTLPTGLAVNAFGLSQREVHRDLPIQAQGTYFYEIPVTNTASIEFSTASAHPIDLYLYVDAWDGTRWEWIGGSGAGGPSQYFRVEPATATRYRVRVDGGINVPTGGSTFDLTVKAVRGTDLIVTPPLVPGPIAPGATVTFTVSYDRPGLVPGVYDGKIFVGPPEAPTLVSIPLQLTYGSPAPQPTNTPLACTPEIRDVPPDNWAFPFIQDLYCRGVVSGYLDRTFHPGERTTRVQFLAMLGRAQRWELITPAAPTFNDVPPSYWGYGYIETAVRKGLIDGYADGGFHPVAPITRAQVSKLVVRVAGWNTALSPPPGPAFRDVPVGHWAHEYVYQAAAHGLVSGYADGTFQPNWPATRAQMAKILFNLVRAP